MRAQTPGILGNLCPDSDLSDLRDTLRPVHLLDRGAQHAVTRGAGRPPQRQRRAGPVAQTRCAPRGSVDRRPTGRARRADAARTAMGAPGRRPTAQGARPGWSAPTRRAAPGRPWAAGGNDEAPTPLRADAEDLRGGRYWDRTSDLFRVKEARYPCANRPRWVRDSNPCVRLCRPLPRLSANPPRYAREGWIPVCERMTGLEPATLTLAR